MITENNFLNYVKEHFTDKELILVTQREPYVHTMQGKGIKEIKVVRPVGGVSILIDALLRKTNGTVFAIASGDADHLMVDKEGKIAVPPWNPSYTLKRIFLSEKERKGFYDGFSNQTIWPLFHAVFVKPKFHALWWKNYVKVNKRFADAILAEVKDKKAFVWIHDYHFALLPQMIKKQRPDLGVGVFWHIPWPTHEVFRICPWRKEILEGLLAADFVGVHRTYHVENIVQCAQRDLGVVVDSEPRAIIYKGHTTKLASVPAGVDYDRIESKAKDVKNLNTETLAKELDIPLKKEKIVISVDRIDYTKGIVERLKIIDKFLERHPELHKRIAFVSISVPSRMSINEYKSYNRRITKLADKINEKYRKEQWVPIHMVKRQVPRQDLFAYYQLSDACLITALDDGMNLVAKEYLICADPKKGILLLSKFTGAAKDLKEAILINPFDVEESADALFEGLNLKPEEKEIRNTIMKKTLQEHNIYKWGIDFFTRAL